MIVGLGSENWNRRRTSWMRFWPQDCQRARNLLRAAASLKMTKDSVANFGTVACGILNLQ